MNPRIFGAASSAIGRNRDGISWASHAMRDVDVDLTFAARTGVNVMITGEDGVGKKFLARRIHQQSRPTAPFIVASLPEGPDAADRLDRALVDAVEASAKGTLLIEHAERMASGTQSALIRALESGANRDRTRRRFGHTTAGRVVTAASTALFERVCADEFSQSLFYRLNPIHLVVPPLRDRPEDIPVVLRHWWSKTPGATVPRLSPAAWQRLFTYPWPGNLHQLRAVTVVLAAVNLPRALEPDDLPLP